MGFGGSSHKRKKSDLGNRRIHDDKDFTFNVSQPKKVMEQMKSGDEVKNSLKEEIEQLQKQLEDQLVIRSELEKASTSQPFFQDPIDEASLTKSSKDLIKEISILEFEVKHLEKYLLSLYRKTFQKKQQSVTPTETNCMPARASVDNPSKECCPVLESQPMQDSDVNRSHSSLSYRTPPLYMAVNQAVDSYHSLPLGMLEFAKDDHSSVSLAEHLGGCISDNIRMSANGLSEEMIRCIASIYGQIAEPPLFNHEFPSSPISFPSPPSDSSPLDQFSMWSPHCEGSMEFSGPYFTTLEVQGFCKSTQRLSSVEHKQQHFSSRISHAFFIAYLESIKPLNISFYRSLILQLEQVDPRKLKHEEKLAFWINIHNALVMHAFLVHGTPRGALKRISLALKAAYNIGGQKLSVGDIQSTILGCRPPQPGQWFQSLLFPSPKYKSRDARKAYAMKHPQPLAYFALCSGSHSDPMVRIYTPKSVFQELEIAKEEYVHNNFKIQKGQKIYLPKLVDLYAKESGLCHTGLVDMIEHSVPEFYQTSFKSIQKGKSLKKFEWVPHDFTFRYLLAPDLAK
ncbi:uncharacterized protein LOC143612341 [Bidens hawaiensis]|uniref:uncharacterized protein LOC143612341 n=1 Tax=Bidens hawaiensis TaxID=980011 RepID=UPI004049FDCD